MSEVAEYNNNDGSENVGRDRMHAQTLNQKRQQDHPGQRASAVDGVAFQILPEDIAFRLENKELVAKKRIGDSQDVGGNAKNQVMNPVAQECIKKRIYPNAEKRIPGTGQQIAPKSIARLA